MKPPFFILAVVALLFPRLLPAQFILNGAAGQVNDSCWLLTPPQGFLVGSIWNETKIDLNESFQVVMQMNFGNIDGNGADGILFGFQPLSTSIGNAGEGLGFAGVSPSLGIEFDTWQNGNLGDPSFDHIAISKNGDLNHNSSSNLAGPIKAADNGANIEDGQWHQLRVNWDAEIKELEIWFDCKPRLTYTGDIVNEIFGGDPLVFWGFTAATGGSVNKQQICLSYTTFIDGFEDVVICPGGQFQLGLGGGTSYQWTPNEGLSNPNIPNPIAAPEQTTTYVVEVLDECNNPFFDSLTVFIDGDTVFFELGADTTLCEGLPLQLNATSIGTLNVEYQWSNGSTSPVIDSPSSGLYTVTVTVDDFCVADDRIRVNIIPLPGNTDLGENQVLCLGQTTELDASTSGNPSYLWQDGTSGPIKKVESPGTYTVNISNNCGEATASVLVEYEDCRQVYFPNVFSPNDDGINDIFMPFDGGDVETVLSLKIFDRWGGLVFENHNFLPNDFAAGWDGKTKKQFANPGLYVWLVEIKFRDGFVEQRSGEVNLLR
ncbi:MAG TPA: T9SS type B sorting domain-containing protein [Bacteroidetes bacterium]|nr:T9SS type B sorting domain-containing protein [Bacteroidota bacterium]